VFVFWLYDLKMMLAFRALFEVDTYRVGGLDFPASIYFLNFLRRLYNWRINSLL